MNILECTLPFLTSVFVQVFLNILRLDPHNIMLEICCIMLEINLLLLLLLLLLYYTIFCLCPKAETEVLNSSRVSGRVGFTEV